MAPYTDEFAYITKRYNSIWNHMYETKGFQPQLFAPHLKNQTSEWYTHLTQLHDRLTQVIVNAPAEDEALADMVIELLHSTELEFAKKPLVALVKKYPKKADAVFTHVAQFAYVPGYTNDFIGVDLCRTLINSGELTHTLSALLQHIAIHIRDVAPRMDLSSTDDQAYVNELMVLLLRAPPLEESGVKIDEATLLFVARAMYEFNKKYYDMAVHNMQASGALAVDHFKLYHDTVMVFSRVCNSDKRLINNAISAFHMMETIQQMLRR